MSLESTRRSWDFATRQHNAHKRDQAAFLRSGGSTLFPEERALVGEVAGRRLLHLCCNAGQDTISWSLLGAEALGVDFSGEAISFARQLASEVGTSARFIEAEVLEHLARDPDRHDVVFMSYGAVPWVRDLRALFAGIARVLAPEGRVVILEFHPLAWSFDADFRLADPYFAKAPFVAPVGDYVAEAAGALSPSGHEERPSEPNPYPAYAYQHSVEDYVEAMLAAGLRLTALREWPYSNGCRIHAGLVPIGERRYAVPEGRSNLPLMLGLVAALNTR